MVSGVAGQPPGDGALGGRFGVEVIPDAGVAGPLVLVLAGELDHDTAEPLRDALRAGVDHASGRVLVDCAGLQFCDSTGLNVLLRARLDAKESGCRLELAALQPPVARMFEITGADTVFQIHESLEAALADERRPET
ncbi:STAS domain-containing protein [Streptomyces sp. NPDC020965]|uniref:STAS domain-containing protein n=1 Tax=Streptomyces sp. NPDC020965 TaxID=3365105 RepID=UPI00379376B8